MSLASSEACEGFLALMGIELARPTNPHTTFPGR
jgi:hypothetical protein